MNILVISDTHGHLEKVYDMFEKLKDMTTDGKPIDHIIHCGDYQRDGEAVSEELALPAITVEGNCDGCRSRSFHILETEYGNVLVTHGHRESVDYGLQSLLYLAQENDCIAACFGHTHVPVFEQEAGVTLINPGSPTFPRDGTMGSCALLNLSDHGVDGGIYYYEHLCGPVEKKRSAGGFLRRMMNYSDHL